MINNNNFTLNKKGFFTLISDKITSTLFNLFYCVNHSNTMHYRTSILLLSFSFLCLFSFLIDDEIGIYNSKTKIEYVCIIPRILRIFSYLIYNKLQEQKYSKSSLNYNNSFILQYVIDINIYKISMLTVFCLLTIYYICFLAIIIILNKKNLNNITNTNENVYSNYFLQNNELDITSTLRNSRDIKKYTIISFILFYLGAIFYWILLMPILDLSTHIFTIIYSFKTQNNVYDTNYFYLDKTNNLKLFDSNTILIITIISVINIVLLISICVLYIFFGNKSYKSLTNTDGFSRANSNFEKIYFIFRVILIILRLISKVFLFNSFYINESNISHNVWYYISLHIVFCLILIKVNYNKLLYYNNRMLLTLQYCLFLYIWFIITAIIILFSVYKEYEWLIIIGFIIIYGITNVYIENKLHYIINKINYQELLNYHYLADQYINQIQLIVLNKNNNKAYKTILLGLSEIHKEDCTDNNCIIKYNQLFYIPSINEFVNKESYNSKDNKYYLVFLLSLYLSFAKQTKSNIINISYMAFQASYFGNLIEVCKSLILFNNYNNLFDIYNNYKQSNSYKLNSNLNYNLSINKNNDINSYNKYNKLSIQEMFSTYCILSLTREKIEKELNFIVKENNEKHYLNIKNVVMYNDLTQKLKIGMLQSAQNNFNFWNTFICNTDNKDIYKLGIELFNENLQVDDLYYNVKNIYSNDIEIDKRYSDYVKHVKGDDKLACKIMLNINKNIQSEAVQNNSFYVRENQDIKNLFYSSNSIMIIASSNNQKLIIEKVTEKVYDLFGYSSQQLLGKEIELLMTPFYKSKHMSYVDFHFKTGIKRVISRERMFYGLHKNNYCFPIKIIVKLLPNIESNKLLYMASIQKINLEQDYEYILATPTGKVDSISENLIKMLNLKTERMLENELYIYHIIQDYLFEDNIKNDLHKVNYDDYANFNKSKFNNEIKDRNNCVYLKHLNLINFKSYILKQKDIKKCNFITNFNTINDLIKLTKSLDTDDNINVLKTKHVLNKKNLLKAVLEIINSKECNTISLEVDIKKISYNNKYDTFNNTLYIFKVHCNDVDNLYNSVISNALSNKSNNLNSDIYFENKNNNNNNYVSKSLSKSEENLDKTISEDASSCNISKEENEIISEEESMSILVKDFKRQKKELIIEDLLNNKLNSANLSKKIKNKNVSSYQLSSYNQSNFGFSFYSNYNNFKKKLKNRLNNKKSNIIIKSIGYIVLFLLIIISFYLVITDYIYCLKLSNYYNNISTNYYNFLDLSCIEENLNNLLLNKFLNNRLELNNSNYYNQSRKILKMKQCIKNITFNFNEIYHLYNYDLDYEIQKTLLNQNHIVKEFNKSNLKQIVKVYPLLNFVELMLDYILFMESRKFKFIKYNNFAYTNSSNKYDYDYIENVVFIKENFKETTKHIFDKIQSSTTIIIKNSIESNSFTTYIIFFVRMIIILTSFLIIFPILLYNKRNQRLLLESFFQIKQDDIEQQKELCKLYISICSNIKVDDNANINDINIIANNIDLKDGNSKIKDNSIDKNNETAKINQSKNNNKNVLILKKKKENKNKFKNIVINDKNYYLNIFLLILIVIIIVAIIPVVTLYNKISMLSNSISYINDKIVIDEYAYYLKVNYLNIQNRFLKDIIKTKYNYDINDELIFNTEKNDIIYNSDIKSDNYFVYLINYIKDNNNYISNGLDIDKDIKLLAMTEGNFTNFIVKSDYISKSNDIINLLDISYLHSNRNNTDIYKKLYTSSEGLIEYIKSIQSPLSYTSNYLYSLSQILQNNNTIFDASSIIQSLTDKNYITIDLIQESYINIIFKNINNYLNDSYQEYIEYKQVIFIVLFILFIIIVIVNQIFVWSSIELKVHSMKTDTYKLFSILPLRFVHEYNNMLNFLKKITLDNSI